MIEVLSFKFNSCSDRPESQQVDRDICNQTKLFFPSNLILEIPASFDRVLYFKLYYYW